MCNARLRALFVSAIATALLVLSAQTAAAASSLIYVTNSGGDNIHVVDPRNHKVVSTIDGIEAADGLPSRPRARGSMPTTTRIIPLTSSTGRRASSSRIE